jgi:RNA polymerase sigma-70 factor (ECF subfamily)
VTHDESPGARDAGERAGTSEAEDQERIAQLMRRRSKLSPDEAALLGKVFPQIVAPHREHVWNLLQKQGVKSHEVEDLLQEVLLALHNFILENGFVDNLPGMLHTIAERKGMNHVRDENRAPFTIGLPSSGSEKPRSQLDAEKALHFQEVARRIFAQLSPEHQAVIDKVLLKGLSHTEAAAELGIPEGTLKSRLLAAKRALLVLAEPLLPPSQRGPV